MDAGAVLAGWLHAAPPPPPPAAVVATAVLAMIVAHCEGHRRLLRER